MGYITHLTSRNHNLAYDSPAAASLACCGKIRGAGAFLTSFLSGVCALEKVIARARFGGSWCFWRKTRRSVGSTARLW